MDYWLIGDQRLADQLFLIAHDNHTGKPLVGPHNLDAALAGAVLVELALDGRIKFVDGRIHVIDHRLWREEVTDEVLTEMVRRGDGHTIQAWLAHLGPRVRELVGRRLANAGLVARRESRGLTMRVSVRWPGIDPDVVARPRVRLGAVLSQHDQLDVKTAALAALVHAGGMTRVLNLFDRSVTDRVGVARRLLPKVLVDLLDAVDRAVAAATLTVRR
ncbi:GOLPH3/VPS74 family protein [Micromonospora polyrhachis]|uniref:Golgi phosphoprotein 3 (GPP34) n=1 Tax=Micromonospora polyrhachis TaxID=1282883 RepID=A0A7W7SVI7_9ACTN|nr:GPP34 family phosphoprotein [Micromonospora polyrhachis]MBB4961361.1 hypothetical protein [Micromonospora polyrhachis]